jgi:hypothetical protein
VLLIINLSRHWCDRDKPQSANEACGEVCNEVLIVWWTCLVATARRDNASHTHLGKAQEGDVLEAAMSPKTPTICHHFRAVDKMLGASSRDAHNPKIVQLDHISKTTLHLSKQCLYFGMDMKQTCFGDGDSADRDAFER